MLKILKTLEEQAKYIELKYFKFKACVDNGDLEITHISTNSMLDNPLIKGLTPIDFNKHVLKMGILSSFNVLS